MHKLVALALITVLAGVSPFAAAEPPADAVARTLERHRVPAEGFSFYAHEIGAPEPLIAFNESAPRNPASVMKLLTTLVALEELGPAFTWKTEAYVDGTLREGRLTGDLYLKGQGDPYLLTESFWGLLNGLRQMGLQHIDGDLVLDASHLQPDAADPGDFDGQGTRAYNVQASALLVNFQALNFRFVPEPRTRALRIVADPHPENLAIDNRVRLTSGPCRGWARGLSMQVRHEPTRNVVRFAGSYPASCGEHELYRVLSDTPEYVYQLFKTLWPRHGGTFNGGLREAVVPETARRYASVESRPLAEILRAINKYSNNVMTRQLLLTLAAERMEPPGTTDKGMQVIRSWLGRRGLDFPELVLENGTGLSREERISARHLGQLLLAGYNSRYMPEFISSLPVAGLDGTLQKRFVSTSVEGWLHAKTGSLNNVRSLAGYLVDRQGRRLVVALLHNHASADTRAGEQVQESLLRWLYERP